MVLISRGPSPWGHGLPLFYGFALLWDSRILNAACGKKTESCMGAVGLAAGTTFSHIPLAGTQPWGHTSLQGHLDWRICVLRKQRKWMQGADESSFSLPGKREVANQSSVSFSNLFSFYWFIKFRSLETTASYNPKVISVKS